MKKFPYTGNKAAGGRQAAAVEGDTEVGEGKFHTAKTLWDAMGYVVRSYKKEEFRNLKGREATLRIFGEGGRMLEGDYLGRIGYEVAGGEEEEGGGEGKGRGEEGKEDEERGDDDDDDGLSVQKGGEGQGEKKRRVVECEEREMGSKRKRLLRRGGKIIPPLGLEENGRMRSQSSCLLPSCGDSTMLEQQQHQHCTEEQIGKFEESSRKMVVYEPVANDPPNKKNKKKKIQPLLPPPPSPSHIDSELQHHLHLLRATISDFSTSLIKTSPTTKSTIDQQLLHLTDQRPLPLANGKISSHLKTLYRNIFQDNNGFWRDAFEDFVVGMKKKKEQEGKKKKKEKEEITPSSTIIQAMIWTFLELEVFGGCVIPLSVSPPPPPPKRIPFSLPETEKMANHHHHTRNSDTSTPFTDKLWRILMEHFTFFSSSFPSKTIIPPQHLQTIHTQALLLQAEMSKKVPSTMMISSEKSSSSSSYYRFFKHSHGSIAYCRRFFTADDGHHHHHHLDKNKKKKNNNPSEEEEEKERDIEKVAFTISPGIERVSSSSSSSSSSPSLSGEKTTVVIEPAVIALLGRSGDG